LARQWSVFHHGEDAKILAKREEIRPIFGGEKGQHNVTTFAFRHSEEVKRPKNLKAIDSSLPLRMTECAGLCKVQHDKLYNAQHCKSKCAFTLAEVLITLVIIGVIAALTIPNLMHNYKMKEFEALYKKGYKGLYDLNQKFKQDTNFNIGEYAKENLVGTKNSSGTRAVGSYMLNFLKGTSSTATNYRYIKTLSGSEVYGVWLDDAGNGIVLNNQVYFFEYNGAICPIITVDFNGYKKGPNKLGYDIFSFYFLENGKILPFGANIDLGKIGTSAAQASTYCSYASDSDRNGFGCSYWASLNKAPDGSGKTYWEWLRF